MATKVLIVDDEPDIANLSKVRLTHEGFEVDVAHSGFEALDKVAAEPPDVIVLDVMMPGMDGWEVAARLRDDESTRDIPILMLTALGMAEEDKPGFSNINEYYTKPLDLHELSKRVRRLAETTTRG